MKLRNKKTGQIGNFIINNDHFECVDLDYVPEYRNLAELNSEWGDYKELKKYWHIFGTSIVPTPEGDDEVYDRKNKEIGNYFGTKEEAERAVEKLKALKRLKDKGFRFTAWKNNILLDRTVAGQVRYEFPIDNKDEIEKDLDLLFGGEDDSERDQRIC